jgi:hypothetical protein
MIKVIIIIIIIIVDFIVVIVVVFIAFRRDTIVNNRANKNVPITQT